MTLPTDIMYDIENNCAQAVSLTHRDLTDSDIEDLVFKLRSNVFVKKLVLAQNKLGPRAAKALASLLETNTRIEEICLTNNDIGDEGAKYIAEALKKNNTLKTVYLVNNSIHNDGAIAIFNALEKNTGVEYLNFKSNDFGDRAMLALKTLIENNETLRNINIGSTHITSNGAQYLIEGLKSNSFLEEFYTEYTDISLDDQLTIAEELQRIADARAQGIKPKPKKPVPPPAHVVARMQELSEIFNADKWVGKITEMHKAWEAIPEADKKIFDFERAVTRARQMTPRKPGNRVVFRKPKPKP